MEVKITQENFESYKNGSLPLVIDFWATWCGPCRMIAPLVSQLAEEFDGKIVVSKCDVEEADEVAAELGIKLLPAAAAAAAAHTPPVPAVTPVGGDTLPGAASESRLGSQLD